MGLPQSTPISSASDQIVEGVLSFDAGWRESVLLPPFLNKPEITLVPDGWIASKDLVIEEVTTDKFTVKISSSDQRGKWKWRARGSLLKPGSADTAATENMAVEQCPRHRLS